MRISDHAIVRYLERVKKLDIETIKKEIVPENVAQVIDKFETGKANVNGYGNPPIFKGCQK